MMRWRRQPVRYAHDRDTFLAGATDARGYHAQYADLYSYAREQARQAGRGSPSWDYWLGVAWMARALDGLPNR